LLGTSYPFLRSTSFCVSNFAISPFCVRTVDQYHYLLGIHIVTPAFLACRASLYSAHLSPRDPSRPIYNNRLSYRRLLRRYDVANSRRHSTRNSFRNHTEFLFFPVNGCGIRALLLDFQDTPTSQAGATRLCWRNPFSRCFRARP